MERNLYVLQAIAVLDWNLRLVEGRPGTAAAVAEMGRIRERIMGLPAHVAPGADTLDQIGYVSRILDGTPGFTLENYNLTWNVAD